MSAEAASPDKTSKNNASATGEVVVLRRQDKAQDIKIHITQHDKFEDPTNYVSENAASILRQYGLDRDYE